MSTGHLRYEIKPAAELYVMLGEGDTPEIYARKPKISTAYDWPYAGGNSVDGKTVYIDRTIYREVMDGVIYVRGMSPTQIIHAWIEHEHTEFSIDAGNNPVDNYPPAHGYAQTKEHRYVKMLPVDPERYERCIKPGLKRCVKRFIAMGTKANPPLDVWCGPVIDDPDDDDKKIIRILRAKGVEDAFKLAKISVHYGVGEKKCKDCSMFAPGSAELRKCSVVSGLVRCDRWCDHWDAKKGNGHG